MTPPKTILATSDLSEKSAIALRRSVLLAREHGAQLELLHVVEAPVRGPAADSSLPHPADVARERLESQAARAVADDIAFRCRVETGKDFVVIIRAAREVAADLVVLGAHGSHSLRDMFLGTTAEKVVRKGEHPVLVVRNQPLAPYRRVLVPTDFSDAAREALDFVLELAPEAQIDLLHVYELWGRGRLSIAGAGEEALQRYHRQARGEAEAAMAQWLRGVDFGSRSVERHFRHGHPGILVPETAVERQIELVAMGTAGRSGLPYILLGSVAEHVLREARCDVLTVRPSGFRFELP